MTPEEMIEQLDERREEALQEARDRAAELASADRVNMLAEIVSFGPAVKAISRVSSADNGAVLSVTGSGFDVSRYISSKMSAVDGALQAAEMQAADTFVDAAGMAVDDVLDAEAAVDEAVAEGRARFEGAGGVQ